MLFLSLLLILFTGVHSNARLTDDDDIWNKVDTLHHNINFQFDSLREGIDTRVKDLSLQISNLKNYIDEVHETKQNRMLNELKTLFAKTTAPKQTLFRNCNEALQSNESKGVFKINIPESRLEPFDVVCEKDSAGISWLIIQRRQDGSVDFARNWSDYKEGFGDIRNEFFIGLKKLYALTNLTTQELWFQLEKANGEKRWAKYNGFSIGGESVDYKINSIGKYSGNAGDSFSFHLGNKWHTIDRDNERKCANRYKGGWWYSYDECHRCSLNGIYGSNKFGQGINWGLFNGFKSSLRYVHMAIRPVY